MKGNVLGTAPISKLIWKFALPGILTQVVSSAHNIVDQIFIGQKFGEMGIAATNISFPLASAVTAVSALVGVGAAANFSILLGKGEKENAAKMLETGLFLLLLFGALITVVSSLFLEPMLRLFGATDLMMPYATEYVRIICIGIVFGIFSTGVAYFIRADGRPGFSSVVLLSGAILNMLLDPLFLFVFDMGISGVALATLLGQLLSAVLAWHYIRYRFQSVKIYFRRASYSGHEAKGIFAIGVSAFVTHVLAIAVQIIQMNSFRYYGALSPYGSEIVIAGAGAVSKLSIVFMSVVIGISLGCQPIYGFNLGSRRYDRVKKAYLLAVTYGTVVAGATFLVMQLFPSQLLSIFGSESPLFYEYTTGYIRVGMALLFVNGIQPITSMFCSSIGRPKAALWMTIIRQGILLIPLTFILPMFFGLQGVLTAIPISDGLAAVIVSGFGFRMVRELSAKERVEAGEHLNE